MTEYLLEDADLYKNLFNLFPDAVFLESKDGTVLECNEKALEMYGYTKEEMIGLKVRDLIHEQAAATFQDGLDEDSITDGVFVWISGRKKNGIIFPIQY
ncbi:MAG: PAS domain-containing protein, partial [Desulfomonilia bacterium]